MRFPPDGAVSQAGVWVCHPDLTSLIRVDYDAGQLGAIAEWLEEAGTTRIDPLPSGLPAMAPCISGDVASRLGYQHVQLRDAAFVAHAWAEVGERGRAAAAVQGLLEYFRTEGQVQRLRQSILRPDGTAPTRPHTTFNGTTLGDILAPWGESQNGALGLLLWVAFHCARFGVMPLSDADVEVLGLVLLYLYAVGVAEDRDLGLWGERSKSPRGATSTTLRCVLAGVQEAKRWLIGAVECPRRMTDCLARHLPAELMTQLGEGLVTIVDAMLFRLSQAMAQLLPAESRGDSLGRAADLGLWVALYLDEVLAPSGQVWSERLRQVVIERHQGSLRGLLGDRRYVGDGYLGAYEGETSLDLRVHSAHWLLEERLENGFVAGSEAEWTLGAPLLSAYYGLRCLRAPEPTWRLAQIAELNRALGMITKGGLPEAYLCVPTPTGDFQLVPGPVFAHWPRAMLQLALHLARKTTR